MKTIIDKETGCFIDKNCTLELGGKKFESGGAFLCQRRDTGKMEGFVYANDSKNQVSNWHGTLKIPCSFGVTWRSNFGDLRKAVYFKYS